MPAPLPNAEYWRSSHRCLHGRAYMRRHGHDLEGGTYQHRRQCWQHEFQITSAGLGHVARPAGRHFDLASQVGCYGPLILSNRLTTEDWSLHMSTVLDGDAFGS